MARKVFISFLGTSNYLQTIYSLNGVSSHPVRFVQEALIELLCKDWTKEDKILIFYTGNSEDGEEGSKVKNWDDGGQDHTVENKELENKGLARCLKESFPNLDVKGYEIKTGFTEEDIWSIFDTVYDKILPGDNISFDITHAFRSIPMFSTALFNYAKFMKGAKVSSIYYGAFEKLGPAYKVKNIELKKRIAPIVDLMNIERLQHYTDIANSLKNYGRIKGLGQILAEETESPVIKQVKNAIEDFENYLLVNRMQDIKSGKFVIAIKNNIRALKKSNIPTPIKNVIDELGKEMEEFVPRDSYQNVEAAIHWAAKFNMLPQAYTLGQEYIISRLADKLSDKNPFTDKMKNKKFREFIASICGIPNDDADKKIYKGHLNDYPDLATEILQYPYIKKLRNKYSKLETYRNSINHAKGNIKYEDLKNEFNEAFQSCINSI